MVLTLLRHTTPRVAPGTCYGRTDLDIAETFLEEARTVAETLSPVTRIISSPLKRCYQLAEYLAERLDAPVRGDERLTEMDFGSWEGRLWADIPRSELDAWAADFMHARPHGGESVAMLRERTLEALRGYRLAAAPVLIVTHAGVVKAAFASGDDLAGFKTTLGFGEAISWPQAPDDGAER